MSSSPSTARPTQCSIVTQIAPHFDCEQFRSGKGEKWWAWQGLNLRPLRCQHSALPLSYTPTARSSSEAPPPSQPPSRARRALQARTACPAPPLSLGRESAHHRRRKFLREAVS